MSFFSKLSTWYFSRKALPYWSIILLNCSAILFSGSLVYALNNGIFVTMGILRHLSLTWGVCLTPYLVGFGLFRMYSGIIRYSSFVDLQRVGFAVLPDMAYAVTSQEFADFSSYLVYIRERDLVLSFPLAMGLIWTIHVFVKYFCVTTFRQSKAKRASIFGMKQGGISLAKSIQNQNPVQYALAGFVSGAGNTQNRILMGARVYPFDEGLIDAMRRRRATILFVSPLKSNSIRERPDMATRSTEMGIRIYVTLAAQEWNGRSDLTHAQLRRAKIEDLLPREKIEIGMEAMGRLLRGQRILMAGTVGSISGEMVRRITLLAPDCLILVDQAETSLYDIRSMMAKDWWDINAYTSVADIANRPRMEEIFSEHRPAHVFHAVVCKHVPMMEDNPCESVGDNVDGTHVIVNLAVKYDARKFVMIPTDKAVNPTNMMGYSKRIYEIYIQSLDKVIREGHVEDVMQFATTRFDNVLGSNGSMIPLLHGQIAEGGPVTVTHPDTIRFFMLIPETCRLVLEVGMMGNDGEIFVSDVDKPVRIVDLAKRVIQFSGTKSVEICFTGLRAGEKLYEGVLNDEETTLSTFHPKIKITKIREYDYDAVCQDTNKLADLGRSGNDMAIVGKMKAIVPELKSRHSKYEVLDK